jgi:hypothetical protein
MIHLTTQAFGAFVAVVIVYVCARAILQQLNIWPQNVRRRSAKRRHF